MWTTDPVVTSQKLQKSVITRCGQAMKARDDKASLCDLTDVMLHQRVGVRIGSIARPQILDYRGLS